MKTIISILLILLPLSVFAQNDLNGKIFYGKATEILPPDVDRMPRVIDEIITFQNGVVSCESFKNVSVEQSSYSSEVDGKRAIAFAVVKFNSSARNDRDGREVSVAFSGEVIGYQRLIGTIIINDAGTETQYSVQAEAR